MGPKRLYGNCIKPPKPNTYVPKEEVKKKEQI